MPKLRPITPKELIKILKDRGFVLRRTTGSHMIFKNPQTEKMANIPFHLKEIPRGTLMAILRDSGLSKDDLL